MHLQRGLPPSPPCVTSSSSHPPPPLCLIIVACISNEVLLATVVRLSYVTPFHHSTSHFIHPSHPSPSPHHPPPLPFVTSSSSPLCLVITLIVITILISGRRGDPAHRRGGRRRARSQGAQETHGLGSPLHPCVPPPVLPLIRRQPRAETGAACKLHMICFCCRDVNLYIISLISLYSPFP